MANAQIPNCIDCQCQSGCFQELSRPELELMNKKRLEVNYRKGENICKQGTFAPHIMYIRKGLVKISLDYQNKSTILCLERSGAFIGLETLFGEPIFHYSCATYTDTEICLFEIDAFKQLVESNSNFASKVIQALNERTVRTYERMNTLIQKQMHGRFADILLCLRNRIYFRDQFQIDLGRKDLSEITAMSSESLSRIIKEFNDSGVVQITGKEVRILDVEKLMQISKNG